MFNKKNDKGKRNLENLSIWESELRAKLEFLENSFEWLPLLLLRHLLVSLPNEIELFESLLVFIRWLDILQVEDPRFLGVLEKFVSQSWIDVLSLLYASFPLTVRLVITFEFGLPKFSILCSLSLYYRFARNMEGLRPFSVLLMFLCSAKSTHFVSILE